MQPRIEFLPEKKLAGLKLRMSFMNNRTAELWRNFMPRRAELVNRADNNFYSLEVYNDVSFFQDFNPAKEFDKWAGVIVEDVDALPVGFESLIIPAGSYAVFDYKGSSAEAEKFYRSVYGEWLPASAFVLDNRPHFALMGEKYKNNSPDSEEEIWIPVKPKQDDDQTKIAVDVFDKNAALYEQKFMDVNSYGRSLDIFCNQLSKPNAEILELACGPGNITKYLLSKRPDFKIHGTDLSPNMIDLAKKNNLSATFSLLDCRALKTLNKNFDAIVSGFALPYLSKREALNFITDAAAMLNENGVLYLSTMEDENLSSGWEISSAGNRVFMNYHEAGYIMAQLEQSGMQIVDEHRQDFVKPDGTKMVDLIIVAKK